MKNARKERKAIRWEKLEITSGEIKDAFHARMGLIKDRNGKDLSEAEERKRRRQEYIELCKKS